MTGDAAGLIEEQDAIQETPPPKRQRGRPSGAGTTPKLATDVTGPRYKTYNSDAPNRNQRTSVAWAWWNALPVPAREIIDLTVYRDWPSTLDPTEDSDAKSIEKILGTEPIQSDQDFVDRFGAGDYRAYLNVNPKNEPRRTLFTAYVKCTHDFRDFPPTDRRIDNVANVDISDAKSNGSYVAWLRATGKLKDEQRESKEKEEMATATQGMTELLGKSIERGDRLMEKVVELHTSEPDTPEGPTPEAKLEDTLRLFGKVRDLTQANTPQAPNATDMINGFVAIHKTLTESNNNAPLLERISALEKEVRDKEAAMLNEKLNGITAELRALKETPPPSNVLLPDGSSLNAIVEKAVAKAVESGLGESDNSWWVDPLKQLMPIAIPALLRSFLQPATPPPQSFPMPPATYQAGAQQQQQAQLPAPTQQQPTQQAQPQTGAYTTGNPQLDGLLMAITVSLADYLRDGASGSEFAAEFIEMQGIDIHTMLAQQVGVDTITNILATYPPLSGVMKKVTKEKLNQFVTEFVQYKEPAQPQPA